MEMVIRLSRVEETVKALNFACYLATTKAVGGCFDHCLTADASSLASHSHCQRLSFSIILGSGARNPRSLEELGILSSSSLPLVRS